VFGYVEEIVFMFSHNQQIIMYYNDNHTRKEKIKARDTIYEPTIEELGDILRGFSFEEKDYYYEKFKVRKNRTNLIIKKNGVSFILYNIKNKNVERFKKSINTFKILRPYRVENNILDLEL
jgi:hypothetical protein